MENVESTWKIRENSIKDRNIYGKIWLILVWWPSWVNWMSAHLHHPWDGTRWSALFCSAKGLSHIADFMRHFRCAFKEADKDILVWVSYKISANDVFKPKVRIRSRKWSCSFWDIHWDIHWDSKGAGSPRTHQNGDESMSPLDSIGIMIRRGWKGEGQLT